MGPSPKMLRVAVVESSEEFAALKGEWEDLYQNASLATPFQSWAWLYTWWEHYGEGRRLRLVSVREPEGMLVGVIPLMLERRWGLGWLMFVGTGLSDYLDLLVREGWEDAVSEAGVRAIRDIDGWRIAELQELRPEAAAWRIFEGWSRWKTSVAQSGCPVIEVRAWEQLLSSLSKNHRKIARRTLRRAQEDKVSHHLASLNEVEQAARRWITLHREAWRGRDIAPEHLTRTFELHLEAAARRMTAGGLGGVSEFRRDGMVIVSLFLLFGKESVGAYMVGASQEALERYSISSLYIWDGLNVALERGNARLDLLRGEEAYKLRWTSKVIPSRRVILGRDPLSWFFYALYRTLRRRLRRYAESGRAPGWVERTTTGLRRS